MFMLEILILMDVIILFTSRNVVSVAGNLVNNGLRLLIYIIVQKNFNLMSFNTNNNNTMQEFLCMLILR